GLVWGTNRRSTFGPATSWNTASTGSARRGKKSSPPNDGGRLTHGSGRRAIRRFSRDTPFADRAQAAALAAVRPGHGHRLPPDLAVGAGGLAHRQRHRPFGQQLPQFLHADPDRDRRELLRDHG